MAQSIDESLKPVLAQSEVSAHRARFGAPHWNFRPTRAFAAGALAVAAVALALLTQFGITQGSPIPDVGYGFVAAALLFAAAAWLARRSSSATSAGAVPAPQPLRLPSVRWELALLAGVIGLAIFFRFFRFTSFPPGIWYDEAINGTDALSIIDHDHITAWRTSNFGHSTIYFYLLIVSFRAFGYTVFAFRIVPAVAGLATVVAFYFLARWLLGAIPALVATALLAVSRFPVTFSRISWEASLQPLLEILSVYFLVRALETKRRLYFVLAGGALAAGLYTYLGFRFVPVMIAFILVYVAVAERRLLLRNLPGLALYAVSFAVIVLPLAQYAVRHQDEVLARTRDINVFKEIDQKHSYEPLKSNIRSTLKMINVAGDRNGRHNLAGAPAVDEVSAALIVLGLVVCAWSIRDWRKGSMAGWLALALIPGALTISIENPSEIRSVGAIPPLFLVAGLAVAFLYRVLTPTRVGAALFAVGAIGLVGGSTALNYHQLFGDQAHSKVVYDAFIPVYTDVGKVAASKAGTNDVWVAGDFFDHPVFRVLTRGKTVRRWTPSAQFVFPTDGRDVVLLMDARDFGMMPTLEHLYPNLRRNDHVDPFGRVYFSTVTIPASDVATSHALPLTLTPGGLSDASPPARTWTQGDLAGGPVTATWDGYLWVSTYPGTTSISLESPGDVRIEIDGKQVAAGADTVTSPPQDLAFGEHRVRLIANVSRPGATSASIAMGGAPVAASTLLYGRGLGDKGFQAIFRTGADFSAPPAQVTHVQFPIGALPPGTRTGEYRGVYTATESGTYGFALDAGSSAQLFVDDALVVDNGGGHPPRRVEGTIDLLSGPHIVSIQYSNPSPTAWTLYLRPPEAEWKLADGSEFTPPAGPFVPPAVVTLTLAQPSGTVIPGLDQPTAVTVLPDGTVAIGSRSKIVLVAPDGGTRTIATPAQDIVDLDATPDGRIAVLDGEGKSLYVLDETGNVQTRVEHAFESAAGVAVHGSDAYVTSPASGIIYRVPLAGGDAAQLPISTAPPEVKAIQPSDIAITDDGTLYVTDFERAQIVISPDGVTSKKMPGVSGTGVQVPHIAIYGRLEVVSDPINSRILIYDRTGKQRGVFQFNGAQGKAVGIAATAAGDVYAVDSLSGTLYDLKVVIPPEAKDLLQ